MLMRFDPATLEAAAKVADAVVDQERKKLIDRGRDPSFSVKGSVARRVAIAIRLLAPDSSKAEHPIIDRTTGDCLNESADEIVRLRAELQKIHVYADHYMEGAGEPEFSQFSFIAASARAAIVKSQKPKGENR
jgi:hypothetical protein